MTAVVEGHALHGLVGPRPRFADARGTLISFEGIRLLPTYHPAAVLYNRRLDSALTKDLQKVAELVREDRARMPRGIEGEAVDFAQQRRPLVPGDARPEPGIGRRPAPIRLEHARARRGEVAQPVGFAQRHAKQLRQQIAQVGGGIAPRALVEI